MSAMSAIDWTVIAAGIAAALWVNWYFFLAGRDAQTVVVKSASAATGSGSGAAAAVGAPTAPADSIPEISIVVSGGYSPSTIRVPAGRPVRLVFDRRETSACSEEVVFPDFSLRRFLPANEKTTITITPPAPGTYEFACGMSMLHGKVIAE